MFCTECSQELPSNARYCSACGSRTSVQDLSNGPTSPKRLFRLPADRKIAGICAGLAEYLGVDVTVVRILVLTIVCVTGFVPGIVAYIGGWILMPTPPMPLRAPSHPVTTAV